MTTTLQGKVVLITGPARGIGAAVARRLAERGARLALVGLEPERLRALHAALGPGHFWRVCDVVDHEALQRAVDDAARELGGIDVVLANAGIASFGTVAVTPAHALKRVIDVNVSGVLHTAAATLPYLRERRGYLLVVSSAAALAAAPGLAAYAASKSAVEQFANCLRLEVGGDGVSVGSAHPCWIDTDLVRDPREEMPSFDAMLRALPGPFGTVTSLDACADAIVEAIARRRRKVFIPRSLAPLAAVRQLFMSPLSDWLVQRRARRLVAQQEREVRAIGSSFGRHSTER
ncbi:MAG TPA: SDR family oxidoreductase [Gemmatimonadaceae bacterium]|nr:SDR family oxidoreductase [Gemmatimonadaceae bacterium]